MIWFWTVTEWLGWAGLAAGAALVLPRFKSRNYRGRLITKPATRLLKTTPRSFRAGLWLVVWSSWFVLLGPAIFFGGLTSRIPYLIVTFGQACPWLDDFLTGGDYDVRRRLRAVGNRIKWRMTLPAPRRVNPGTA